MVANNKPGGTTTTLARQEVNPHHVLLGAMTITLSGQARLCSPSTDPIWTATTAVQALAAMAEAILDMATTTPGMVVATMVMATSPVQGVKKPALGIAMVEALEVAVATRHLINTRFYIHYTYKYIIFPRSKRKSRWTC